MTRHRSIASALAALVSAGLLTACGSGSTKTVSVANTETPPSTSAAATTAASSTSTSVASTSTASISSTSGASTSTRTQSAPAFVQTTTAGPANGPSATLAARGYVPVSTGQLNSQDTLQVLIGSRQIGSGQKAFFFVDGRYIGTDTVIPSSQITIVGSNDTEVTLGYALTRSDGSSAGTAQVRYALNNGQLMPLDPIPPASPSAPVSRR